MEPDARMEFENRIAMTPRFSTSFDAQDLGCAVGLHLPGLQWLAGFDRRGSLSLPRWSCLDGRFTAGRP